MLSKHTRYIHSLKEYQGDPQYFLDTLLRFLHDSRATLDNMEAMLYVVLVSYCDVLFLFMFIQHILSGLVYLTLFLMLSGERM